MRELIKDRYKFEDRLEEIGASRSKTLKVLVLYFHGSWLNFDKDVISNLDGFLDTLERCYGNEAIRILEVSVYDMKEVIGLFKLVSYPTAIVMGPDLSEVERLTLHDVMGNPVAVKQRFRPLDVKPVPDIGGFLMRLETAIARVVQGPVGVVNAYSKPFPQLMVQLRLAIYSEDEDLGEECSSSDEEYGDEYGSSDDEYGY